MLVLVIVKEVGNGIFGLMVKKLIDVGVVVIDVGGVGGIFWVKIEGEWVIDLC